MGETLKPQTAPDGEANAVLDGSLPPASVHANEGTGGKVERVRIEALNKFSPFSQTPSDTVRVRLVDTEENPAAKVLDMKELLERKTELKGG